MKHNNYDVVKTKEWEDDWIIQPIDGYGNQEIMQFYDLGMKNLI